MEALIAVPRDTVMNISIVSPTTIECPAMMFAKKTNHQGKGLSDGPVISITCINGIGALSQVGTSGQKIFL